MAARYKLRDLEERHGDLHTVIPALVNQHGQYEAGRLLGVSGATISNWLRDNGYTLKTEYVRELEEQAS